MNIFKFVIYDIRYGTLRYKRYIYLIIVCILQCMLAQIQLDNLISYANIADHSDFNYSLRHVVFEIFGGCDPIIKSKTNSFPYPWFAIFICVLLITFDYMYLDLTQLGIQVISRAGYRIKWWISKCIWNIITVTFSYLLIITISVLFTLMINKPLNLSDDSEIELLLSMQTSCYSANDSLRLDVLDVLMLFCSPLIVMITISMLQMMLSFILKPEISLSLIIGLIVMSVFTDSFIAFPRMGMILYSSAFYKDGYPLQVGIIICASIILVSILTGVAIVKRLDILPAKEDK